MTNDPRTNMGSPTPEELREQVERSRDELGQTVDALAGKAGITAQATEKTAVAKERAAEKTAAVVDQISVTAHRAAQLVKDTTPDPVLHKAGQVASVARANRKPLLVAGAALVAFQLVRRSRVGR
ncbi:DUF3618 domain-containing protein [Streptomyces sp. NPDC059456]|uniref:DUF3618 domain-containing protein n=1 Tax=Streptomyces sp. NPDC059456 TaxID=3346838 RepID=UPI0036857BE1